MVNESRQSTVGIELNVLRVLDVAEFQKDWLVGQSQDIQREDNLPICRPSVLVYVLVSNHLPGIGSHVMHVDSEVLAMRHDEIDAVRSEAQMRKITRGLYIDPMSRRAYDESSRAATKSIRHLCS